MDNLSSKKKVVYIGGGNGVVNVIPVLRDEYDVTAIITTFDNGGSSGRLRYAYKTPLTGDVRRALMSLSTNELGKLSEHRFEKGDIEGHTFGNLLLACVYDRQEDPQAAMKQLHELLAVRGQVLPVSYTLAELNAELMDRTILRGEHVIDEPHAKSHIRIRRLWIDPEPAAAPGVIEAIEAADLIILGPGDLYTSVLPNLLVAGVSQALLNAKGKRLYFCNIFTTFGQTNGFTAYDFLKALEFYAGGKFIDTVVINTSKVSEDLLDELKRRDEGLVRPDIELLKKAGYDVLSVDLLDGTLHEKSAADNLKRCKVKYEPSKILELVKSLCA